MTLLETLGVDLPWRIRTSKPPGSGRRGVFDPAAPDDALSTSVLTRLLVRELALPVIAAAGIMDGSGIAAMLRLGASAAQLGTYRTDGLVAAVAAELRQACS